MTSRAVRFASGDRKPYAVNQAQMGKYNPIMRACAKVSDLITHTP